MSRENAFTKTYELVSDLFKTIEEWKYFLADYLQTTFALQTPTPIVISIVSLVFMNR